jgi:hypothetical protein
VRKLGFKGECGHYWNLCFGFHLTFRTLFRNSEAILPASLQGEETELAADAFTAHNPLFL